MKYFLLGFIVSELICCVIYCLTNDEEKGLLAGGFLIIYPINFFLKIFKHLRVNYIRKNYIGVGLNFGIKDKHQGNENVKFTCVNTFRAKKSWLKKYHDSKNPIEILTEDDLVSVYYLEPVEGKYVENVESIRNIKKEKLYTQQWVNDNLLLK